MSYTTVWKASQDPALLHRITAGANKEALNNPLYGDTVFGQQVQEGTALTTPRFAFPVAVANEAAYEFALNSGNPDPGGARAVITDEDIPAAIQPNWPADG